jgi:phytoene dehydrogenase-like protein
VGGSYDYDVVIVGGGIAGLTAAAYLCNSGYQVVVCEKEKKVGGLVNSFNYKGFTFDGGIRAIENSGIVMPMLRQLGLHIDFVDNLFLLVSKKKSSGLFQKIALRIIRHY